MSVDEYKTKLPFGESLLTVEPLTMLTIKMLEYRCPWCLTRVLGGGGFEVIASDDYLDSPDGVVVRRFRVASGKRVCACVEASLWLSNDPPMTGVELIELLMEQEASDAPLSA